MNRHQKSCGDMLYSQCMSHQQNWKWQVTLGMLVSSIYITVTRQRLCRHLREPGATVLFLGCNQGWRMEDMTTANQGKGGGKLQASWDRRHLAEIARREHTPAHSWCANPDTSFFFLATLIPFSPSIEVTWKHSLLIKDGPHLWTGIFNNKPRILFVKLLFLNSKRTPSIHRYIKHPTFVIYF